MDGVRRGYGSPENAGVRDVLWRDFRACGGPSGLGLLSQVEFFQQFLVAAVVGAIEIIQQAAALADHAKQAMP